MEVDPQGYVNGMNTYAFLGDNALSRNDPVGTNWKVTRDGQPTAVAEAGTCGSADTVASLAAQISLDANEYRSWLQSADGGPLPATTNTPVAPGRKFAVPNVAALDIDFDYTLLENEVAWQVQDVQSHINNWTSLGLDIQTQYNVTAQNVRLHLESNDLYTYYYTGHGEYDVFGLSQNPTFAGGLDTADGKTVIPQTYTKYGIEEMVLASCYSNYAAVKWANNVARSGIGLTTYSGHLWSYWNTPVFQSGTR
jgi:hypothetical protein